MSPHGHGWAVEQGFRAHQRVPKLSEGGLSQPPELEESSHAKTAKRRTRVPRASGVLLYWIVEIILHYLAQMARELIGLFRAILMHRVQMSRRRRSNRTIVTRRPDQMKPRRRARSAYGDETMEACPVGEGPPNEWVLHSGAPLHHTSNLELLLDFQFQETPTTAKDAPPSPSGHVLGVGSVRTERFEFPGVRYVVVAGDDDDDARNVVSVAQLARDHGLVTVFKPTSCHVKHKKTGQIVGEGRLRNGMYMLDSLRIVAVGGKVCVRRDATDGDGDGGGGHGGQGNNGQVGEGRGGGARDSMGGGAGARNQQEDEGSGSGAAGDVNNDEINEEDKGSEEKETNEIEGKGEKEQDKKRRVPVFAIILPLVYLVASCLLICFSNGDEDIIITIAVLLAVIAGLLGNTLFPLTSEEAAAAPDLSFSAFAFHLLSSSFTFLRPFFMVLSTTTICKLKQIRRSLFRGKIHGTRESTGYGRRRLPAAAFLTSRDGVHYEEFLVDSGASLHMTWNGSILFPYPQHLHNHTKQPLESIEGITGPVAVTRSGYLNGDRIMLDGVLLTPQSRVNLVSVGQLAIQYGAELEMDEAGFIIKRQQDGVQIGGGKILDNHLYILEYFQSPEGLFAHRPTPHFKIFGRWPPSK